MKKKESPVDALILTEEQTRMLSLVCTVPGHHDPFCTSGFVRSPQLATCFAVINDRGAESWETKTRAVPKKQPSKRRNWV